MAVVDTVTADVVLTQRRELACYTEMHDRLRDLSLSPHGSLALLGGMADRLTD
jgi:hypothetical protein